MQTKDSRAEHRIEWFKTHVIAVQVKVTNTLNLIAVAGGLPCKLGSFGDVYRNVVHRSS